jgi:hypothetical protein
MKNETLVGEEDELVMNEDVGSWSDFKYRLVQLYCQLFTAGMKGKWGSLVYVDPYSGSGQSRVIGTGEILLGSPLIGTHFKCSLSEVHDLADCYVANSSSRQSALIFGGA